MTLIKLSEAQKTALIYLYNNEFSYGKDSRLPLEIKSRAVLGALYSKKLAKSEWSWFRAVVTLTELGKEMAEELK